MDKWQVKEGCIIWYLVKYNILIEDKLLGLLHSSPTLGRKTQLPSVCFWSSSPVPAGRSSVVEVTTGGLPDLDLALTLVDLLTLGGVSSLFLGRPLPLRGDWRVVSSLVLAGLDSGGVGGIARRVGRGGVRNDSLSRCKYTNCNKFYCNLTFYKLNTYLIVTSACLVLWSKNVSTDKNFLRNILVTRGDPLSAHVRACAVVVVDRRMSRVLHCIFGPQKTN